ncbi:MAG: hypothetical protein ACFNYG_08495, partial [Lautropia mirabilis]
MPITPSALSDRNPSPPPSSPRKAPLTAALMAALALWSLPGHAAITNVGYTLTSDGTPGWDPTDGPGLDSGPKNGIVRTHDEINYQVAISYADGTKDVQVELTLPRGADGKPLAEWPSSAPTTCLPGKSSVSADRQKLIRAVPDYTGAGTNSGNFTAKVLGSNRNGAQLPAPTLKVNGTGQVGLTSANQPPALTISAAPHYDVLINSSYQGSPKAYGYQGEGGPN